MNVIYRSNIGVFIGDAPDGGRLRFNGEEGDNKSEAGESADVSFSPLSFNSVLK
jgi:hypothetical protein